MALLSEDARRSATVTALEEAETFAIYRPQFEQLRRQHPEVNGILFRFLAGEVRLLNERLLEALYVPVERRGAATAGGVGGTLPRRGREKR